MSDAQTTDRLTPISPDAAPDLGNFALEPDAVKGEIPQRVIDELGSEYAPEGSLHGIGIAHFRLLQEHSELGRESVARYLIPL